jgi:hypothetical protein
VLLHQPVFHSIAESQWNQTVTSQLAAHGSVVEVRARPASVELASLESGAAGVIHHCSGRGLPFDPNSDDSPLAQASEPGACTLTYAAPTGVDGNRDRWYGYVLVNWDGAYRVNGGEWIDLDGLFSVRYFQRSVRELGAVLRGATRSRTQR